MSGVRRTGRGQVAMIEMNRRQFLNFSGKFLAAAVLFCLFPKKIFYRNSPAIEFMPRFKAFRQSELYEEHNLAG